MTLVQSPLSAEGSLQKGEDLALEQAALMAEMQLMNSLSSFTSRPASPITGYTNERSETQTAIKKERRLIIKLETGILTSDETPSPVECKTKPESRHTATKASNKAQRAESPVTAIDLLDKILGIDVRGRIQESSTQCLATAKTKATRCQIAVRATSKQRILTSLDALSEQKVGSDSRGWAEELAAFVDLTFCGRHHRSQTLTSVDEWKRENLKMKDSGISPTVSKKRVPASTPVKSEEVSASWGELKLEPSQRKKDVKIERSPEKLTSPHQHGIPPPWTFRYDLRPSIRNMKRYAPELTCYHSYHCHHSSPSSTASGDRRISQTMNKALGVKALKSGFLYVYRHAGEKDFFKIGYSTIGVNHRMRQWEKQCGHKIEVVYPSNDTEKLAISHVQRVEALVHVEMGDYRYREEDCEGCGKNHVEWFKVGEEHIRAVIEKWVDWIKEEPYEEKNDVWTLKKQQKRDVGIMCAPLKPRVRIRENDWEPQVPIRSSTLTSVVG
ncbi:hypothetical protein MMC30_005428 [Trapelia coarctata]|nr:hypothetical protein [Trapelia coarctata]